MPDDRRGVEIVERAWREGIARFEVAVLMLVVMSNHWHAELRVLGADPTEVSRFMQFVKSQVAREMNQLRGRHGVFWAERFHAIRVLDDASVIDRIVYGLHNPVAAGLCGSASEWPGLSTLEATTGMRAACGPIELPVALPEAWVGLSPAALEDRRAWMRAELRDRERAEAAVRRARGLERPRAARVIAAVRPGDRPRRPKRSRAPLCFAATKKARDAFVEAWRELMDAYTTASERFRSGLLDAPFPADMFPPWLVRPPNEVPS